MKLTQHLAEFIIYVPGQSDPVLDIRALRRVSGWALAVSDDPAYSHFLAIYGGYLPVANLTPWLRVERTQMDAIALQELQALIEPMRQFAEALTPPRALGSSTYRRAPHQERRFVGAASAQKRWSTKNKRITGGTIRVIHARMVAGDSLGEAAKAAGVAASTAAYLRKRTYPAWNADLEAAWQETFGTDTVKAPVKGGWPMRPETRAARDRDRATLLRRVHELLQRDASGARGKTQKEAGLALGLSRSQIGKLIGQDPSKWGPECATAWSETFGGSRKAQEPPI